MHSLLSRLLLALFVIVVAALGTVAIYGSSATSNEFQRYVNKESARRAQAMAELLIYYRQNRSWNNVQPFLQQMSRILGDRIVLADSGGRIIADSAGELESAASARLRGLLEEPVEVPTSLGEPAVLITSADVPSVYVYLQSLENDPSGTVFLGEVNRQLLLGASVAGLVGLLLILLFSRSILRPVHALTEAARRMEKGDLRQRVDASARDEIGELAAAFNAMADGISQQEQLRRNIVSDVAHELRTPVANLRGYLEALRDGVTEPTPALIRSLHDETLLLSRLLDDLQDLAQAEAGKVSLQQEACTIDEMVHRVLRQMQPQISDKGLRLELRLDPKLPLVDIDDERIGQVLRNLLSNAITYTPSGGLIRIQASSLRSEVEVSVGDTGVGIAAEHLPFVFERFYRTDWSRARQTGGTGLGLAIAKQWVEAHGGQIHAESIIGQGTTIRFTLPISEMQMPESEE